jgi:hypothetical protein
MTTRKPVNLNASAVDLAVLATQVEHVKEDQTEIKTAIIGINDSLKVLGRIEERQLGVVRDFNGLVINKDTHEKRITDIETELPPLREMRSWVIKGVSAGVGMLFLGIISLVGGTFAERYIPRQYVGAFVVPANPPVHTP